MPALREVRSDIPRIVHHLLPTAGQRAGNPAVRIADEAVGALIAAAWPGNVRQLLHELERASLRADDGEIRVEHLSPELRQACTGAHRLADRKRDLAESWERDQLRAGLEGNGWHVSSLARELGVSRRGLTGKLARYGLRRP